MNTVTTTTACLHCGDVSVLSKDVNGEPEAHDYENGVCTVCKHECQHTGAVVSVDSKVKEYINKTDETHTAVNTVTTTTTCKYCEYGSESSKDVNGEPEEHTYVDGVCTVCKHECEHTDAEVSVDSKVKEYINKTDETHTAVNTVTTTTACKYCDYVSESSKDVNGEPGSAHLCRPASARCASTNARTASQKARMCSSPASLSSPTARPATPRWATSTRSPIAPAAGCRWTM